VARAGGDGYQLGVRIEVWADLVCPWCYLGKRRLERALEAFPHRAEVEVVHRAFELDPTRPPGQTFDRLESLASKYGLTAARARTLEEEMERRAAADGLELHLVGGAVGNTFDAHRVVHLAREAGREDAALERLYRAHFTEGLSIFTRAALAALAGEVGLDPAAIARALAGDAAVDAVRGEARLAGELGVTGVPFFVLDGRWAVSGAQPRELFEAALARAWVERQPQPAASPPRG
jgi:predicted DsbA family dithiol-disulfide isomerase